jgi:hypothetical protein
VAVKVVIEPSQTVPEAETPIVGVVPTPKFKVCVAIHPTLFVPVTVYIVVDAGVTVTLAPVRVPGFQV